jgi:hypothetical protein
MSRLRSLPRFNLRMLRAAISTTTSDHYAFRLAQERGSPQPTGFPSQMLGEFQGGRKEYGHPMKPQLRDTRRHRKGRVKLRREGG